MTALDTLYRLFKQYDNREAAKAVLFCKIYGLTVQEFVIYAPVEYALDLANNYETPDNVFEFLSLHKDNSVRLALACNHTATTHVLVELLSDEKDNVRLQARKTLDWKNSHA